MKFKEWWIANKAKITKISKWWLLPRKFKILVETIIFAIEYYLSRQADTTVTTIPLEDIVININDRKNLRDLKNVA